MQTRKLRQVQYHFYCQKENLQDRVDRELRRYKPGVTIFDIEIDGDPAWKYGDNRYVLTVVTEREA